MAGSSTEHSPMIQQVSNGDLLRDRLKKMSEPPRGIDEDVSMEVADKFALLWRNSVEQPAWKILRRREFLTITAAGALLINLGMSPGWEDAGSLLERSASTGGSIRGSWFSGRKHLYHLSHADQQGLTGYSLEKHWSNDSGNY